MSNLVYRNGSSSSLSLSVRSTHSKYLHLNRERGVRSFPTSRQLASYSPKRSIFAPCTREPHDSLSRFRHSPNQTILARSATLPLRAASTTTSTKSPPPPIIPSLSPSSTTPVTTPPISQQSTSSASSSSSSSPPTSSTPTSKLNPSPTTHPPLLTLPTRTPTQSTFSFYFSIGRTYLSFYKSALRNILTSRRTSLTLLSRSSLPRTLLFISTSRLLSAAAPTSAFATAPSTAQSSTTLSRADLQTILRTRSDVRRIPLFALVFAACGEFTPLVVLFLSGVVPRSAWILRQVEKERKKKWERREEGLQKLAGETEHVRGKDETIIQDREDKARIGGESGGDKVRILSKEELLHISRSLGLHARAWDVMWENPPLWLVRRWVEGWVRYLEVDDALIGRDGGWEGLNEVEVFRAAEERGCIGLGVKEREVREGLERWFEGKKEGGDVVDMLCEVLGPEKADERG